MRYTCRLQSGSLLILFLVFYILLCRSLYNGMNNDVELKEYDDVSMIKRQMTVKEITIEETTTWGAFTEEVKSCFERDELPPWAYSIILHHGKKTITITSTEDFIKRNGFKNQRFRVFLSEGCVYCEKMERDVETYDWEPISHISCYSNKELDNLLKELNNEPLLIIELTSNESFNMFFQWDILFNLMQGIESGRVELLMPSNLIIP